MPAIDFSSSQTIHIRADSSDVADGAGAQNLLDPVPGWVSTSRDRGSIDILWSSCATIFLCIWVATYPNAPAPKDRWYHFYIDKMNLAIIGIVGPDALCALALGQLSSAIRSRKQFRKEPLRAEGQTWDIRKAFFADMGGFHLKTPDFPEGFPLDAEQLHFLIKHGFVEYPADEVWEHAFGGFDVLSRIITLLQVILFTATEIDRLRRGYPMTTLELTALSFAFTMFGTSAAWFLKPSATRPYVLESSFTAAYIRERAGALDPAYAVSSLDTWYQTPLMFLSRSATYRFGVHYSWVAYFSTSLGCSPLFQRAMRNPRQWDRWFSDHYIPMEPALSVIIIGFTVWLFYCAIFLLAWNFHFPTDVERLLWRICAIAHCILTFIAGAYASISSLRWGAHRKRRKRRATLSPEVHVFQGTRTTRALPLTLVEDQERGATLEVERRANFSRLERWMEHFRNLSPDQDPKMRMPLRILVPFAILVGLFFPFRFYIFAEDFASMRELPVGAYITVNKFLPFIGS